MNVQSDHVATSRFGTILDSTQNSNNEFALLHKSLQPVSQRSLDEALQELKYDMHREMQGIIKEQNRLFAVAKVCFLYLFKSKVFVFN